MQPRVYVTRLLPPQGEELLRERCEVIVHPREEPPTREEVIENIRNKDAILCLLTDRIDGDVIAAGENIRVISTMSVGF